MNWKAFVPLAIAIVLGLLAARVGMSLVSSNPQAVIMPTHLVSTLVAARDIEAGAAMTEADVVVAQVTPEALPANALTQPSQIANRVLKVGVSKGQALAPTLLADDGAGYGVSATLPPGFRAITLAITDTTGVAGFIQPKCKVDVITTFNNDGKSMAKTLLEGITVLAVGSRTNPTTPVDPQQPQSRTVTLLVKPKDAEKI
jgi:pilus assembly protein CpaB